MDQSANLELPYLLPAQAQKHVTHNQALRRLDAIIQIGAKSRVIGAPPIGPLEGDCYVVPVGATGEWQDRDGELAAWQDSNWAFYNAGTGWIAYIEDEEILVVWDGQAWLNVLAALANSLNTLGINGAADTTNRLTVSSPASLFDHEGSSHRVKVNKAASADTASVLFQTAYSGRAEFGLTGADNFQVKVSPDGVTWHPAIDIDQSTGQVVLPNTLIREVILSDRTYYVRADGDDGNLGTQDDAGNAFATIQRAVDAVSALDLSIYSATIQVAPGTYTDPVVLRSYLGAGPVSIIGAPSDPGQVVLDNVGDCISGDAITGLYMLEGLKLRGTNRCIYMNAGATCKFDKLQFDGPGIHIYARAQGVAQATDAGSYEITATQFSRHAYANLPGSTITAFGNTITLPVAGTVITGEFAHAKRAAAINIGSCTFINKTSASGPRYQVKENAILITGGPEDYLPGDSNGTVSTGGILT